MNSYTIEFFGINKQLIPVNYKPKQIIKKKSQWLLLLIKNNWIFAGT